MTTHRIPYKCCIHCVWLPILAGCLWGGVGWYLSPAITGQVAGFTLDRSQFNLIGMFCRLCEKARFHLKKHLMHIGNKQTSCRNTQDLYWHLGFLAAGQQRYQLGPLWSPYVMCVIISELQVNRFSPKNNLAYIIGGIEDYLENREIHNFHIDVLLNIA